VALPNILAKKMIVPELIQHDATPAKVTAQVQRLLTKPTDWQAQQQALHDIHVELQGGQAACAAEAVLALIAQEQVA
jgi:lipid-A-disaccharide synthase